MSKSLSIFRTKQSLAFDLISMLNSSVDSSDKYFNIVKRLCRRYTRLELVELWKKTYSSKSEVKNV